MQISFDELNRFHLDTYITTGDTDYDYCASMAAYQTYVQEIASVHATLRATSFQDMQDDGKTWVISRSRMEVFSYAKWMDDVKLISWAQNPQGLTFPRCVVAEKGDGTPLFSCQTKWAVIDMKTGRPIRANSVADLIKLPPKDLVVFNMPNLKELYDQAAQTLAEFYPTIVYSDIDYNHHVNNRSYTHWSLDSLPFEFRNSYKLSLIDVHWVRQAFYSDKLRVVAKGRDAAELKKDNPCIAFEIYKQNEDGSETLVFDAWTEWKPNSAFGL